MNPTKSYFKDTCHHLYNRGVNKLNVFHDEQDYAYFVKRLRDYKERYRMAVLAFCLLPNHFHIMVRQTSDEPTVGRFVGDLLNSYTKATNKKYRRSGVLFEAPTKSKPVTALMNRIMKWY